MLLFKVFYPQFIIFIERISTSVNRIWFIKKKEKNFNIFLWSFMVLIKLTLNSF